ncbi:MAG: DivIVA domain-containing protein [Clostridiales bacterium]|nr:DivIVA domain-containing protein [Clostridiales bacterium]
MTNGKINFPEVMKGYDMEQVDNYISKLSAAYQAAYDENTAIRERYNNLLDDFKKLSSQEETEINPEIILMYAEMLAQKIIADAQAEAAQIKAEAQKVYTEANNLSTQTMSEAQKNMIEANSEADKALIQTRKKIEQANEMMNSTLEKIQAMMAQTMPEIKNIID